MRAKENDQKGQNLRANQLRLFNNLTAQGFVIKKGNFLFNSGGYHEKGVDVKLAVDLLVGAYDDIWDIAIIISSDSDLNPAIKKVKHLNKNVEYIGFSHSPCYSLQKVLSLSRLLIKDDIEEFIAFKSGGGRF
ncbi:MAG: NYN domain-containing protein [bacterium]|nr:NYN domain-containing protein [bacterium]